MINNKTVQAGFSLIEVIIYVALTIVLVTVFTAFTTDVVKGAAKIFASKEVHQNYRLVLNRLTQDLKTAKQILDLQVDEITIENAQGDTVRYYFDSAGKTIYYDNGADVYPLHGPEVEVTALVFTAIGQAIRLEISLEKAADFKPGSSPYSLSGYSMVIPRPQIY